MTRSDGMAVTAVELWGVDNKTAKSVLVGVLALSDPKDPSSKCVVRPGGPPWLIGNLEHDGARLSRWDTLAANEMARKHGVKETVTDARYFPKDGVRFLVVLAAHAEGWASRILDE